MSTIESLQATLAAEHAAIFVYGDAGAHTSQSAEPELFTTISMLYRTHRARRDQLRLLIGDRGATPVAAAASYELPSVLRSAVAVRRQALRTEETCAEVYAALVANTATTDRDWAISALLEAAQARIQLNGSPEVFPGAPELAG
ncbi:MAG: ferritin-like domain-containing protein [Nocardioides sp.]|uniref:ferritin-like domain-containing protein n=1 Tax=Nocardioides sp. TaxID=35761 RepID=UPI003265ED67